MSKVTVSEHAISAQHAFHNSAAAVHKTAMAGEKEGSSQHAYHKGMAAAHEECAGKLSECMKALAAADLEKSRQLVPSPITNVTITPIPRTGSRPVSERPTVETAPAPPNVPLEFVKLFSIDDGELDRPIL
jgi:hypothetical protein